MALGALKRVRGRFAEGMKGGSQLTCEGGSHKILGLGERWWSLGGKKERTIERGGRAVSCWAELCRPRGGGALYNQEVIS